MTEKENPIYDAYKEQNKSRQKYWLAAAVAVVSFGLGFLIGLI